MNLVFLSVKKDSCFGTVPYLRGSSYDANGNLEELKFDIVKFSIILLQNDVR